MLLFGTAIVNLLKVSMLKEQRQLNCGTSLKQVHVVVTKKLENEVVSALMMPADFRFRRRISHFSGVEEDDEERTNTTPFFDELAPC